MEWKEDEEELLEVFIEAGYTHKEIAKELDRTIKSVRMKCNRLNVKSKNINTLKTNEEYDKELLEKCPTIKRIGNYINNRTKILHKCLVCGKEHLAAPRNKLDRREHCGFNSNGNGIDPNEPGINYLIHIPKLDIDDMWFIKYGITGNTVKMRFSGVLKPSEYEIILEIHSDLGLKTMEIEKEWSKNVEHLKANTRELRDGNTETFYY